MVGRAHPVADPVFGNGGGARPAVASGGGLYLAVWRSFRDESIHGARFDAEGNQLDPLGIVIGEGAANVSNDPPAIAFDGTSFLVVWPTDARGGADLLGARVTPAGELLDEVGFPITTAPGPQLDPSAAWDGTQHLVTWKDHRDHNWNIYAARVTSDGVVLDQEGLPVSIGRQGQHGPEVTWSGDHFLVVWADARRYEGIAQDVFGARVDPDGIVLDPEGILIGKVQGSPIPDAAWDGTTSLVVWAGPGRGSADEIFGARVSATGVVLDQGGFEVSKEGDQYSYPSVAWNGGTYLVAWSGAGVRGTRVTPDGAVLDPHGIRMQVGGWKSPSVAEGPGGFGIVSNGCDQACHTSGVAGTIVSTDGMVTEPPLQLSVSANAQLSPDVAWNGQMYFVVWNDAVGDQDIYGAQVTAGGDHLDGHGIDITGPRYSNDPAHVIWDGQNFLVVWLSFDSDVIGTRITAQGEVLDPEGFLISSSGHNQYWPDLASDGTTTLVVWEHRKGGPSDIYANRVTPNGEVLDGDGFPVSAQMGTEEGPRVAWDGVNWLVVWKKQAQNEIYAARVNSEGDVLDPGGIPVAIAPKEQSLPEVASAGDGSGSLVVWQDFRTSDKGEVFGTRVTAEGEVLDQDGLVLASSHRANVAPAVGWGGHNYLVSWENGVVSGQDADVLGVRVSRDGEVVDAVPIMLAASGTDEFSPAEVGGPEGRTALAYVRYSQANYGTWRVFLRFVDEPT